MSVFKIDGAKEGSEGIEANLACQAIFHDSFIRRQQRKQPCPRNTGVCPSACPIEYMGRSRAAVSLGARRRGDGPYSEPSSEPMIAGWRDSTAPQPTLNVQSLLGLGPRAVPPNPARCGGLGWGGEGNGADYGPPICDPPVCLETLARRGRVKKRRHRPPPFGQPVPKPPFSPFLRVPPVRMPFQGCKARGQLSPWRETLHVTGDKHGTVVSAGGCPL